MDKGSQVLQQLIAYAKYAGYIPSLQRRETIEENIDKNMAMHLMRFPFMRKELDQIYGLIREGRLLPSMRSLQFGGSPIIKHPTKLFNCAYQPISHYKTIPETMYLLLAGTGFGYSVRNAHISQLPVLVVPGPDHEYVVDDSIEGWADAVKVLMEAYYFGAPRPVFSFRDIRPSGTRLSSGVIAPGPAKLEICLQKIEELLRRAKVGDQLTSLEIHDILCYIADAVVAGGVRRSAMIALFDWNDVLMLTCKVGDWWADNPQRGRANNSVALNKTWPEHILKERFDYVAKYTKEALLSGSGDPGIVFVNHDDYGYNPCKPLTSTILTKDGNITYAQALDKDGLEVVLMDGTIVQATKPFKTRENAPIRQLRLSNGTIVEGTDNHRHKRVPKRHRTDGSVRPGNIEDAVWVELAEFETGDYIAYQPVDVHHTKSVDEEQRRLGAICGWIVGDGWLKKSNTVGMCFGPHERDTQSMVEDWVGCTATPHVQKPDTCWVLNLNQTDSKPYRDLIGDDKWDVEWVRLQSHSFKLGWLQALFTADGSVRKQNGKGGVELYTTRPELAHFVQSLLSEFGIYSGVMVHNKAKQYISTDGKARNNATTWKVAIPQGMFRRIGFLCEHKQTALLEYVDENYRYDGYLRVVEVIPHVRYEDVYDITVDHPDHSYLENGVVVHNCGEALLKNNFCNLVEIVGAHVNNQQEFDEVSSVAGQLSTFQATYTKFPYLRRVWQEETEREALVGVGITGMVEGAVLDLDMYQAATRVKQANAEFARTLGINPAHRTTVIKPSGTSTLYAGLHGSGVHDAPTKGPYLRRIRVGKTEAIYHYLLLNMPNLLEDEAFDPQNTAVFTIPRMADTSKIRHWADTPIEFLERVGHVYDNWILGGHNEGPNGATNNVSATVYVRPAEHEEVFQWLWDNRNRYQGMSLLPRDDANYPQLPIEPCDDQTYQDKVQYLREFSASMVYEPVDGTEFAATGACVGGACEVQ